MEEVVLRPITDYYGYVAWGEYAHCFAAVLNQEECYRLILAKGGNPDLKDINGCTVTHILVVFDNMKMFDMAVECGAAINIPNNNNLTPLTMAAYLAKYASNINPHKIHFNHYVCVTEWTCSSTLLALREKCTGSLGMLYVQHIL